MLPSTFLFCFLASFYAFSGVLAASYAPPDYAAFGTASWPNSLSWSSLNETVGGRLMPLRPWAAVCYMDDPLYNWNSCQTVLSHYTSDVAREAVASALLWAEWESCHYGGGCALNYSNPQPVSGEPCHQGTTPPFSVAIQNAQDASNIVKWATANNVKLTIKNTGHDYLGRSAGPSSLQIFTHGLNSVTYAPEFVPRGSNNQPVSAITIGAGAQLQQIYEVAGQHDVSVALGACPTIGAAGGYMQGGGHGLLTPAYGLAVEHVLEVEIVTADGEIRTVNSAQNEDLFWAVRGGGAGSWGIVTSVTFATLPQMQISASFLVIVPNESQDLRKLGVRFIALLGKYQNGFLDSGATTSLIYYDNQYSLATWWPTSKAPVSMLYPFFEELLAQSNDYVVKSNKTAAAMFSSVTTVQQDDIGPLAESVNFFGSSNQLASRFVLRSMLEDPQSINNVAGAIVEGYQILNAPFQNDPRGTISPKQGVYIYGNLPAGTRNQVNATGANPGFYEASWNVMFGATSTMGASERTYRLVRSAIYNALGPLKALGLTNCYQNEASPWETDWQQAFFGYKYEVLLAIKQKFDPDNFFTTYKGVGSAPDSAAYGCYQSAQPGGS